MVDKQAKTSLSLEPTSFKISFSNFKPSINKYLEEWQTSWNNSIGNKLLDIKPTIGEYQSVVRNIPFGMWRLCTSKNNCFHVDNMKELFQDIHIDSIMTLLDK